MNEFNEATELALKTWYPKDHPLHFNPHHPLGKLIGEWGELLDDYMKSPYKPGYKFEPLDELGDVWYYLRILAYQMSIVPDRIDKITFPELNFTLDIVSGETEVLITAAIYSASQTFLLSFDMDKLQLNANMSIIEEIAMRYDITLDQLTKSNWNKLKPGSERGDEWAKARVETNYQRGKIAIK